MMNRLALMKPSRMFFAMIAAAFVFFLANGTLGGYEGASYALTAPGAPVPGGTPSDGDLKTTGPDGQKRSCKDYEEARGGYLLGRIVPCVTKSIEHGASRMSREMIKLLRPTLYAFLTFVIVIFGVQVMQNEGQLQTRAFTLLLKIGFCFAILAAIPGDKDTGEGGLIGTAYAIMAESQAVVMSTLGPEYGNIHCEIEKFGDENTPMIWKQMDCLLSKLAGFTIGSPGPSGEARPNMLLASSIVGLLGGFFFSGSFGVALFLACIGMLVSMFVLILRVLVAFLNSYMFIGFYMILAPLLLPLMFMKVTSSLFEKWYSGILASLLLPMVVCGYVVIAMQVYDKLFFADDALITKLFDNEIMDRARQLPQAMCNANIANNPDFRPEATGLNAKDIYNSPMFSSINSLTTAGVNLCGGVTKTNLNLDGMTDTKGQPIATKEAFEKLFYDCIKLFVMSLLINMGFNTVMSAVRPMLGSGAVVAALDTGTKTEAQFKQSLASAKETFQGSFYDKDGNNVSGTTFLRQIPTAFSDSANAFLSGMQVTQRKAPGGAGGGTGGTGGAGGAGAGAGGGGDGGDSGGGGGGGNAPADDGDAPDSKGAGGGAPRAGAGSGPSGAPATKPSVRNATPAERYEAAERVLGAQDAKRLEELEQTIERGGLPAERLKELQDEYERLIDRIDQGNGE